MQDAGAGRVRLCPPSQRANRTQAGSLCSIGLPDCRAISQSNPRSSFQGSVLVVVLLLVILLILLLVVVLVLVLG
jgi:hypothetical protein